MQNNESEKLGILPIPMLLFQQSLPASLGILMLSIYNIIDSIFVGQFVGSLAIGALAVVLPITFFISALGMAVGVGGGSIISRSLGAHDYEKAFKTFGNQTIITLGLSILVAFISYFFIDKILLMFGGQGDLLEPAKTYFYILLPSTPFLAWAMMSNNVFRAEGLPKIAMITMFIPAIVNVVLDPLLIVYFDMGIEGAAWATAIAYYLSGVYTFLYFIKGKSVMNIDVKYLRLQYEIVREIIEIGGVSFIRQSAISLLAIVLNNSLFYYGSEAAVSAYGIINRLMMFANFPVFGLTQGFVPIAGYNYGAKHWERVKESILKVIKYGLIIASFTFAVLVFFPEAIVKLFTTDETLIKETYPALRLVFLMTPLLIIQLISSAYYQAVGKALPALILTLLKQVIFLIPLVLLLPNVWGLQGVWYAFPLADFLTTVVSGIFIYTSIKRLDKKVIVTDLNS